MELGLILFSLVPLLLVVLAVVRYKRLKAQQAEREALFKMKIEAMTARVKKSEREQDLQREAYRRDLERKSSPVVSKPVTPFTSTSDTRTMTTPSSDDTNNIATVMLFNNMMSNSSVSAVTASYSSDDTPARSSYSSSSSSSSSSDDDSSSRSSYSSSYSSSSSDSSYSSSYDSSSSSSSSDW